MDIEDITIGQARTLSGLFNSANRIASAHGRCLVVADRGHVWVGNARDDGDYTIIEDARIVRRWGTDKGLNQLANEGPRPDTKLDAPATVKVARRAVIALIPCEASAWK